MLSLEGNALVTLKQIGCFILRRVQKFIKEGYASQTKWVVQPIRLCTPQIVSLKNNKWGHATPKVKRYNVTMK